MTNRDLYLAATELVARHADSGRSLEDFLRTLRAALEPRYGQAALAPEELLEALAAGFTRAVPARDERWRTEDLAERDGPVDAAAVDRLLKSQVLDLEDAAVSGALRDAHRSFGRAAGRPEGTVRAGDDYFYNWDPRSFVECGLAGSLGGWEPGDDTGRVLVSGDVAVLGEDGVVAVPAAEVAGPPEVELAGLSWAQVADFLWCGQHYE